MINPNPKPSPDGQHPPGCFCWERTDLQPVIGTVEPNPMIRRRRLRATPVKGRKQDVQTRLRNFDEVSCPLTLAEAIDRLGQTLGVSAALVPASDGRAAIDVDKPDDLALVRSLTSKA